MHLLFLSHALQLPEHVLTGPTCRNPVCVPAAHLLQMLKHGYTAPTFIQAQAWPIAVQGRDLVAIASTGSGKTAGFLLPAFLHIQVL